MTLRQASFDLVNIVAFVDNDSRIVNIGRTPGTIRSTSICYLSVLPVKVDLIHDEWDVSNVVG